MSEATNMPVMPRGDELIVSSSPHVQIKESVSGIMIKVLIALLPAAVAAVYFFGFNAFKVMILTMFFCVGAEALWCWLAKKPVWGTVKDCSALLTGLLLAMNLSAGVAWYVCLIGAFLAIWLGKQVYGGLGHNPFNPALVARVGLLIALPGAMTSWVPADKMTPENEYGQYSKVFYSASDWELLSKGETAKLDSMSCATPLGIAGTTTKILGHGVNANENFSAIDNPKSNLNYFLGNVGGCLGETSALALIFGGCLLLLWKLINWRIPVFFIGTVFVFTGIINCFFPGVTPTPIFHVVTGGLMLGAFFMATDMVTSPMTNSGAILFAVGCGLITSVIRIWGNYPEGVSFSILFMNALVPFIDRLCSKRPFGYVVAKKG